jgi:hypothetical protein
MIRYRLNDLADSFVSDEKVGSPINLTGDQREKYLRSFLSSQVHMATMNGGMLSPVSIEEYILTGGFEGIKKCLGSSNPAGIRHLITESGLGRGGAGFPTGKMGNILRTGGKCKVHCLQWG